ncbi:alternative ribosome rescue aminoacyl-tRNA hydrolase ArfB [Aeoliella mucimassa]|uniref:Peptidyl-tRNA hydrolase ArfB n=1 Tax=Aeoliella mucimassa TaxID=2527972 RepID=A0A518AM56_9BACT|nr:alternative ribosome rescue aminoacyl-tRNA hydrolase ArfB [Aeoliella mucimassa]QDU55802.1 Peptidyl-tRNA hydrolase ArfB [Aeoliella mucimassa]
MSEYVAINDSIALPRSELKFSFSRSPGPGGQNVNKLNTKATLHWAYNDSDFLPEEIKLRFGRLFAKRINEAGELVLSSSRHRVQRRNVDDCLEKLRQLILAAAVVPKVRKKPKKSAAATAQRLKEKRERADRKRGRRPPKWDD